MNPRPETVLFERPATTGAESDGGAGGILTIDLAAIAANYRRLVDEAGAASCMAVVKADGYGLGAGRVAAALVRAGCRRFCVAHVGEGVALRGELGPEPEITILHGAMPGAEEACREHDLVPALNSLDQVEAWQRIARTAGRPLPAMLQIDTGMARFGLSQADCARLTAMPRGLEAITLRLIMSHLANADEPDHPGNAIQREAFERMRRGLPAAPASLAASSGIFLGAAFHYDAVRPGAALYGIAPRARIANPMQPVIRLQGRIAQLREVPAGTPVGYGWTARTERPSRLATVAIGYADGFFRGLSNRVAGWVEGRRLPILGRVSMDSIVLDATETPPGALQPGGLVDLIGPDQSVDDLAAAAGTIGYEVLTAFFQRYPRRYLND